MYKKFKIVKVDFQYCDYLRKYDSKVPYNYGKKELRPFIGVLFYVNKIEYFAPLSSPKPKHAKLKNYIDIVKINSGKYGVINLNNMIPVTNNNYEIIDLNKKTCNESEMKWYSLLQTQLRWLNKRMNTIINKSTKLYNYYKDDRLPDRIKDRCCNFMLLEEKCVEYNKNIK